MNAILLFILFLIDNPETKEPKKILEGLHKKFGKSSYWHDEIDLDLSIEEFTEKGFIDEHLQVTEAGTDIIDSNKIINFVVGAVNKRNTKKMEVYYSLRRFILSLLNNDGDGLHQDRLMSICEEIAISDPKKTAEYLRCMVSEGVININDDEIYIITKTGVDAIYSTAFNSTI